MSRILEDQISSNRKKSYVLLILVPALLFLLIYFVGEIFFGSMYISLGGIPFNAFWFFGILIALGYTVLSYFKSDEMVLKAVGAEKADREKYDDLYDMVESLAIGSGMPMPDLYIQEEESINAFATGRKPDDGKICVTTGALRKLDDQELEGVLAHELSHIQNHDVLFMTLVVALVGAISMLSYILLRGSIFGGATRSRRREGGGILILIGLVFAILAPIAAKLTQLAISRKREFLADSSGAHLTRYPEGLASALEKIGRDSGKMDVNDAVSPLYIANPFKGKGKALLSTHPPLEERIKRLREM